MQKTLAKIEILPDFEIKYKEESKSFKQFWF